MSDYRYRFRRRDRLIDAEGTRWAVSRYDEANGQIICTDGARTRFFPDKLYTDGYLLYVPFLGRPAAELREIWDRAGRLHALTWHCKVDFAAEPAH